MRSRKSFFMETPLHRRLMFDLLQQVDDLRRPGIAEEAVQPLVVEGGERGLVEKARDHFAISNQVVDGLLDETNLGSRVGRAVGECAEHSSAQLFPAYIDVHTNDVHTNGGRLNTPHRLMQDSTELFNNKEDREGLQKITVIIPSWVFF